MLSVYCAFGCAETIAPKFTKESVLKEEVHYTTPVLPGELPRIVGSTLPAQSKEHTCLSLNPLR